jgi:hypothetical protein
MCVSAAGVEPVYGVAMHLAILAGGAAAYCVAVVR